MGYVSYAEGFNPGGSAFINKPVTNELVLNTWTAEIISNAELGVRADLANGRVRLQRHVCSTRRGTTQSRPWRCGSATQTAKTAKTRDPSLIRT